ncbi:MAG: acyl-CoA dehydrogenase, partial [Bacteroidales bacterium]|nr:acyl-CoA dehydrogenase [Bacteroidales bacterium]
YVDLSATSKQASRIADILTPLVKLNASEFSNRNAYDCIQVHGGSGFMKEYACERLYRDARILSIYEGTSQLQVVAAMKGIASGAYLKQIADYDQAMPADLQGEKAEILGTLRRATETYKQLYEAVSANGTTDDLFEHNTRALTEVLSYIIMDYLLLLDTLRDESYMASCRYFAQEAIGWATYSLAKVK